MSARTNRVLGATRLCYRWGVQLVFCGTGWFPIVDVIRERLPPGFEIRARDFDRPLLRDLEGADVILPSNARIDAEMIAIPTVRLIQQPAAGFEGIDLAAAKSRGIPVANAPGASGNAVAEAVLFLMLALARRLHDATSSFRRAAIGLPLGVELKGRVLGIVGRGQTGSRLSELGVAFGMNVRSVGSRDGHDAFLRMLAASDFVSINCPLNDATRGLFDDEAFGALKTGAVVINCGRGPIVDRSSVERALDSGRLAGLGLDVFWDEPWDPTEALFQRSNVVVLPHIAGSTEEAFARVADIVVENVLRVSRGEAPLHRVG